MAKNRDIFQAKKFLYLPKNLNKYNLIKNYFVTKTLEK